MDKRKRKSDTFKEKNESDAVSSSVQKPMQKTSADMEKPLEVASALMIKTLISS